MDVSLHIVNADGHLSKLADMVSYLGPFKSSSNFKLMETAMFQAINENPNKKRPCWGTGASGLCFSKMSWNTLRLQIAQLSLFFHDYTDYCNTHTLQAHHFSMLTPFPNLFFLSHFFSKNCSTPSKSWTDFIFIWATVQKIFPYFPWVILVV